MSEVTIYRAMLESPADPQLHRPEGPALVVKLADYDALRAEVERLKAVLERIAKPRGGYVSEIQHEAAEAVRKTSGSAKYRKKPVLVDAWKFVPGMPAPDWVHPSWFKQSVVQFAEEATSMILIPTLEGVFEVRPGYWLIRGVKGEVYPCKPDIFEATYERENSDAD